jgi:hypothetical protein
MSVQVQRVVWSVVILAALLIGVAVIALLWVVEFHETLPDGNERRWTGVLELETRIYYPGKAHLPPEFGPNPVPVGINPVGAIASVALSVLTFVLVVGAIVLSVLRLVRANKRARLGSG